MPARRCHTHAVAILLAAAALAVPVMAAQAQRPCRVAEVVVTPDTGRATVGGTPTPFVAVGYAADGTPCNDVVFSWASSNEAIAVVDQNGFVTGVNVGQATITARTGRGTAQRSGRSRIDVAPTLGTVTTESTGNMAAGLGRPIDRQPEGTGPADQISLAPQRVVLVKGESKMLEEIRAVRADGGNAARIPLVFSVDQGGERIISVDSFGVITSLGDTGVATVRAVPAGTSRARPGVVRVEVKGDPIQFPRPVISMAPGAVDSIYPFIPVQSRAVEYRGLFRFRSSDSTRVRVNPIHPYIEALAAGRATVTATSSYYPDIVLTINVHQRVDRLRLAPLDSQITIAIGGRHTVRAEALAANGAPIPEAPLTWSHPDSAVRVTGTGDSRVIEGRAMGNAVVTVSAPGLGDQAFTQRVRVRVVAGGIAVAQPRLALPVGQRRPIEATLQDESRQNVGSANEYLQWTSTADSVAGVEANQVVARRPGVARLRGVARWDSSVTIQVTVVGDIIVASQQAGRWDLITMWENGSRRMPLTSDTLVDAFPAWSPDLTRVAYTAGVASSRTLTSALYVMNADGGNQVRLTDDSAQVAFPRWVPGGNRIIFEWNKGGRAHIWAHNLGPDGSPGTNQPITGARIPGAPHMAPSLTPDGSRMVYVSRRETSPGRQANQILSAALDGTDERVLTTSSQMLDAPQFSPDGNTLYFIRQEPRGQMRRVARLNLTGADSASALTPPTTFVQSFSVSGDGQTLALHIVERAGNVETPRVVLFRIATGEVTALGGPDDRFARPAMRPSPRP